MGALLRKAEKKAQEDKELENFMKSLTDPNGHFDWKTKPVDYMYMY